MAPVSRLPEIVMTPHRNLRSLYLTCLLIIVWAGILPVLLIASILLPPIVILVVTLPLLMLVVGIIWWIGAYHRSILYRFTETGIRWERGVWRRQAGIVPYDQITAIDIVQGPLARLFRISDLDIRADRFPSGSVRGFLLKIRGLPEPESLRDSIRERIGGSIFIRPAEHADTGNPGKR
jgi:hypothetical protein